MCPYKANVKRLVGVWEIGLVSHGVILVAIVCDARTTSFIKIARCVRPTACPGHKTVESET